MHPDLKATIDRAVSGYDALMKKEIKVNQANAIIGFNQNVISAHAIDLRERMFLHDQKLHIEEVQRRVAEGRPPATLEGAVEKEPRQARLKGE